MRVLGWTLLVMGCRPYVPPAVTPPLTVAQAPLRVIRLESAVSAVDLVVRAGSAYDPPGREGLAFVTAQIVAMRLGAVADVGVETVRFSLPASVRSDAAAGLLLAVQPVELDYARAVATARLRSAECTAVAQDVGLSWVFAGHPYGHAIAGRLSTLPTLTPAEVSAFYAVRYVRDAAAFAVSGSDIVVPQLDAAFAPRLSRSPTPAVKPSTNRATLVVEAHVDATCAFVALKPEQQTRQNVAQLAWAAETSGWHAAPANVDSLGWAVLPWPEWVPALAFVPPTLVATPSTNVSSAKLGTVPAGPAAAAAMLITEVPRLVNEPALGESPDPTWFTRAVGDGMFTAVVVTPDASLWRAHESSDTLVVLDREAAIR